MGKQATVPVWTGCEADEDLDSNFYDKLMLCGGGAGGEQPAPGFPAWRWWVQAHK